MASVNGSTVKTVALVISIAMACVSFGWGFGSRKADELQASIVSQDARIRTLEVSVAADRAEILTKLENIERELNALREEIAQLRKRVER